MMSCGSDRPEAARPTGYDVIRIALGLLLLVAAGLKGHQLATEPVAETGLLTSRWFLIAAVEFELVFGLWLLLGLYPRRTWQVALLCFGGFACVSLSKALSGDSSCGCFGKVPVNPWYTLLLDLAAVAALLYRRPPTGSILGAAQRYLFTPSGYRPGGRFVGFGSSGSVGDGKLSCCRGR